MGGHRQTNRHVQVENATVRHCPYPTQRYPELNKLLYESRPQMAVECDFCGTRYPRSEGYLCGEPERPRFSQDQFMCVYCQCTASWPSPDSQETDSPTGSPTELDN